MTYPAKKRIVSVSLIVIGALVAVLCWPESAFENQGDGSVEPGLDERYRELVLGNWQDEFKGLRTLTIRADGTASMVVEPEGLNAIFAARMTFEEVWSIEEGQFRVKAVGGKPEARVNLILKTMGTESDQKILELTKERLLLLDADGKTIYDWRRMD